MKQKIGTQVDEALFDEVRVLAARERRAIGEIVEAALSDYVERSKEKTPVKSGLRRFLESPDFNLTDEQFRETMEADFYEQ
jgi:predicted transcriptional regulator